MYYVIEFDNRPDGITNSDMKGYQSFASAMAYFYQRCAVAVATELFISVVLTVIDNDGNIIENKVLQTNYHEPTTE
jgi:hypothetical protein